jgi:hypothetical protein
MSYQREHVKTSIAVQAIDLASNRLGYFHNTGYHQLTAGFRRSVRIGRRIHVSRLRAWRS